jgi:hypothetical protein
MGRPTRAAIAKFNSPSIEDLPFETDRFEAD